MSHGAIDYALMPAWLLYTRWNEQDFLFAMNGQTGKMTGNLPIDPGKSAAWFAGIAAAVFAFFTAVMLLMDTELTGSLLAIAIGLALVVGGITLAAMRGQMRPVAEATRAAYYLDQKKSSITLRRDTYVRTVETRTPIQKNHPGNPGVHRGGPHAK